MTTKTQTETRKVFLLDPAKCRLAPELARIQKAMPTAPEDKESIFESIAREGRVRDSVKGYFKDNTFFILSGWTRREGAIKAGIKLPCEEVEIAGGEQRAFFAATENTHRRQMTIESKRGLVRAMLMEYYMQGNRPIARACGVYPKIVESIRAQLIKEHKIPESHFIMTAHGKLRAVKNVVSPQTMIQRLTTRIAVNEERIVALQAVIKQDHKRINALRKDLR